MKPRPTHSPHPKGYTKFIIPHLTAKDTIMNTSSLDIMCATEFKEFFYEDTGEVVPEGEPIGLDVETDEGVELVLFSNVYWSPQYDEMEDE